MTTLYTYDSNQYKNRGVLMFIYKNNSTATKKFYGVSFAPGEEHEVPGYINDAKFVLLDQFSKAASTTPAKKLAKSTTATALSEADASGTNADNKEVNKNG